MRALRGMAWLAARLADVLLAPARMPPAALRLVRMMRVQGWNTALRLQTARFLASPLALHLAPLLALPLALLLGRVLPCHFPRGRSSPPSSRRRRKSFSCAMGLPSVRRRSLRCSCRGAAVRSSAMSSSSRLTLCMLTRAASTRSAACIPSKSSWTSCTSTREKASSREGRCALERCRAEREVAAIARSAAASGRPGKVLLVPCFSRDRAPASQGLAFFPSPQKRKSPPNGELSVRFNSSLLYAFAVKKFASSFANASSTSASSSSLLKARVWHSSSAPMSVWLM